MKISNRRLADFYMLLKDCDLEDIHKIIVLICIEMETRGVDEPRFNALRRDITKERQKQALTEQFGLGSPRFAPGTGHAAQQRKDNEKNNERVN